MSEINGYRDLEAWQVAMDTVMKTYSVSAMFPRSETYGLMAQMRRAAISIPSNIAEGHARRSIRACLSYLGIALGSLAELDTQLEIALRLGYSSATAASDLAASIESARRLLYGLRRGKWRQLTASGAAIAVLVLLAVRLVG